MQHTALSSQQQPRSGIWPKVSSPTPGPPVPPPPHLTQPGSLSQARRQAPPVAQSSSSGEAPPMRATSPYIPSNEPSLPILEARSEGGRCVRPPSVRVRGHTFLHIYTTSSSLLRSVGHRMPHLGGCGCTCLARRSIRQTEGSQEPHDCALMRCTAFSTCHGHTLIGAQQP